MIKKIIATVALTAITSTSFADVLVDGTLAELHEAQHEALTLKSERPTTAVNCWCPRVASMGTSSCAVRSQVGYYYSSRFVLERAAADRIAEMAAPISLD